jgi:hypothetical protein
LLDETGSFFQNLVGRIAGTPVERLSGEFTATSHRPSVPGIAGPDRSERHRSREEVSTSQHGEYEPMLPIRHRNGGVSLILDSKMPALPKVDLRKGAA